MKTFIVLVLFAAACISSSSALRCYSCVFPGDPKCEDVKDMSGDECSEPGTIEKAAGIKAVCLKNVIDVKGAKQITRSCTKQGGQTTACSLLGEHVEHCSVCETDLCNKSTFVVSSVWSIALPAAIIMFMKLF